MGCLSALHHTKPPDYTLHHTTPASRLLSPRQSDPSGRFQEQFPPNDGRPPAPAVCPSAVSYRSAPEQILLCPGGKQIRIGTWRGCMCECLCHGGIVSNVRCLCLCAHRRAHARVYGYLVGCLADDGLHVIHKRRNRTQQIITVVACRLCMCAYVLVCARMRTQVCSYE